MKAISLPAQVTIPVQCLCCGHTERPFRYMFAPPEASFATRAQNGSVVFYDCDDEIISPARVEAHKQAMVHKIVDAAKEAIRVDANE